MFIHALFFTEGSAFAKFLFIGWTVPVRKKEMIDFSLTESNTTSCVV